MPHTEAPGVDCWVNYYEPPAPGALPEENDMAVLLGEKALSARLMRINDARGREADFRLTRNGIQFEKLRTSLSDFDDPEKIRATYFPEVQELVKRVTGAKDVFVYDHNVRRAPGNEFGSHVKGYQGVQGPAKRIHVDATPEGAESIMRFMCCDEDPDTIKRRGFHLINVWRPLKRIDRDPLIVADAALMPPEDLVKINRSYFNGLTNSNYICKYGGAGGSVKTLDGQGNWQHHGDTSRVADGLSNGGEHRWWYWGGQEPDEAILFSSSLVTPDESRYGAVHGSCPLPDQEGKAVRESIEVRVIAVF